MARNTSRDLVKVRNLQQALMEMPDNDLVDVLEHVLKRRAVGFDETFSALSHQERLLAKLRATVTDWELELSGNKR